MAPEGLGAQVLPDLDLGSENFCMIPQTHFNTSPPPLNSHFITMTKIILLNGTKQAVCQKMSEINHFYNAAKLLSTDKRIRKGERHLRSARGVPC